MIRTSLLVAVAAAIGGLSGCSTMSSSSGGEGSSFSYNPAVTQPSNKSNVRVALSTGAQRVYVLEGDKVLLASPVSVGTSSDPTPHGNFKIYSKQKNRRRVSQPGAGYPMAYWMEFKSAYGMHWGFVKPHPCTHGCVRLPLNTARKMFDIVPTGAPLNIASSQPWDSTIGRSLPTLDDSSLPDPPDSYMMSSRVFDDMDSGKLWNF